MKQIIIKGENVLNVPNLLSFYRLVISPVILILALSGNESLYAIFLCISLVSDILDGNIARFFKLQTRFGAALDNLADMCTYALAFIGIYLFKWTEIQPHAWIFYIFIGTLVISYLVSFIRFGKIPRYTCIQLYLPVMPRVFLFLYFLHLVFIPGCFIQYWYGEPWPTLKKY